MAMVPRKIKCNALAILLLLLGAEYAVSAPGDIVKEFSLVGHSFVADRTRNIVYMSVTGNNSVAILDMNTLELSGSIFVGSNPRGMAVSRDGKTLYVAIAGASSLAVGPVNTA
jgi:YVTN family beta-propeller protein